jgi:HSP20 family protein
MSYLHRLQNAVPVLPHPEQGCGATTESSLSIIVFFTFNVPIELIIPHMPVIIRRTICQMSLEKVEDIMARKQNEDLLIEDELAAAFLSDDDLSSADAPAPAATDDTWDDSEEEFPGQLAVDVYETDEKLVVKARTAGVNKEELDVSISDGILTISGTLSSGDDTEASNWHIQECYWGEFSRTLALPVSVKEDEVEAVLKDGVLTVTFSKIKQEQAKKIQVQ